MLGTFGRSGERLSPVTANALVFPASTSGMDGGPSTMANRHCSLRTHVFDSFEPLNGIATAGMPVFSFRSSEAMVKDGDEVLLFDLSGCALAQATSSLMLLAG